MKCPRDGSVLVFTDEARHMSNKCTRCRGLLLGEEDVAGALGAKRVPDTSRIAALPGAGIACPRDGQPMHRLEHRGVELDLCPECKALWLDGGELEKVRERAGKGRAKATALAAGAALAGAATVAAAEPAKASLVSGAAELVGELAVEGVIEVVFELVAEGLGALLS